MPKQPSHARRHDQFYTQREVASHLVALARSVLGVDAGTWVEPSAGDGAFLDALSGVPGAVVAFDLDPARKDIQKQDFLSWSAPGNLAGPVVFVGNPPFGKNASLAVRFFNHAAPVADAICMIFPRTFEKASVQNRLDRTQDLIHEQVLPPRSFVFEGQPVEVPCVFQVWRKLPEGQLRPLSAVARTHPDFRFVERAEADFAFQRVGVRAGAIKEPALVSRESHLFIQAAERGKADLVRDRLASIDWTPIKCRTAGNPSIGKGEIVQAYSERWPDKA